MVKRKGSKRRSSAARTTTKTRTVYRTAPRRAHHRKSMGYDKIPGAAATAALLAVNLPGIKAAYDYLDYYGNPGSLTSVMHRVPILVAGSTNNAKKARDKIIGTDALIADAVALVGGYVGGYAVQKYAPTMIKKPIAKVAKKLPRVI